MPNIGFVRRRWPDVLLFELVGVGLGMLIGVFVSDNAQTISGFGDPAAFQNFGLATGAIVGVSIALLAMLCYLALVRLTKRREMRHIGLHIWVGGIAGAAITLISYCIVTRSAETYGIVERTGTVARLWTA